MGPYSRAFCDIKRERGAGGGVISSKLEGGLVELAAKWKVYSGHQAATVLRVNRDAVRRALSRLVKRGYIDRLVTGHAPPLYTLGPEGSRVCKTPLEEWDTPRAFRLVMSHQLYLSLPELFEYWPDPGRGLDGLLKLKQIEYPVLCPRVGEAEVERCLVILGLLPEDIRPIVVAATEEEAVKVATRIERGVELRYVWDSELVTRRFCFYRWTGGRLEPSEEVTKNFIRPLDRAAWMG
ncbi:hypothetical protein V3F56_02790 [Moorellaceae bacterium AZ2]